MLYSLRLGVLDDPKISDVFRKALDHQKSLLQLLTSSLEATRAAGGEVTVSREAVAHAQRDLKELEFSDCLDQSFYAEKQTTSSIAVHKVFSIPEILENILRELTIIDILDVQQVNRTFRDTVNSSPMLQRQLFLAADKSCNLRALERPHRSSELNSEAVIVSCVHYPDEDCAFAHGYELFARFESRLLKTGSRVRRMYICQPPITSMTYRPECCRGATRLEWTEFGDAWFNRIKAWDAEPPTIENDDGLTIGDSYDVAADLQIAHKMCPYEGVGWIEETGDPKVSVTFRTEVTTNPIEKTIMAEEVEEDTVALRRERYRNAKMGGMC